MPVRVSHLPNFYERRALQKFLSQSELLASKLASKVTIRKMVAKGWIKRGGSIRTYAITSAGEAALRAKIPD
jgi:hypothetical protein